MARKEVIQYYDDIDGSPLSQEEVVVVNFGYRGTDYVMDLSPENAQKFAELLSPYMQVARRPIADRRRTPRRSGTSANSRTRSRMVREWARENGIEVNDRGKLPTKIVEAFKAANPGVL